MPSSMRAISHQPHWRRGYLVPLQSADIPDAVDDLYHSDEDCRHFWRVCAMVGDVESEL